MKRAKQQFQQGVKTTTWIGEFWKVGNQYHRVGGPAIIYNTGTREWWQRGKLHRTDGPAMLFKDGGMEWFQNGKRHRTDGPAIVWPNGEIAGYCLNGELVDPLVHFILANKPKNG